MKVELTKMKVGLGISIESPGSKLPKTPFYVHYITYVARPLSCLKKIVTIFYLRYPDVHLP
jgi:hypothetical protein